MGRYDFIHLGLTYDELDEFQKHKADWLEKEYDSDSTKSAYWQRIDGKIHRYEIKKGEDLYDWKKEEIVKLIKNTQTDSLATKKTLYSVIVRYMEWAYGEGIKTGENPCDNIDTSELFIINEMALKESYQTLEKFYNFILGLDCTDVDRMMFTLLRYGATVDNVGTIKWEDVDRENMILNIRTEDNLLELPIDNLFIERMDMAKMCTDRITTKLEQSYVDCGYIVKTVDTSKWITIPSGKVYNSISEISKKNQINRISVPDLRNARKYDVLLDKLNNIGKVSGYDVNEVLEIFDGFYSNQKRLLLRKVFEGISGITVEHMSRANKGIKNKGEKETNESDNKTEQLNAEDIDNFIDTEDSSYQNEIAKAIKDSDNDISSHEYKPKDKKSNQSNTSKNIYRRDSKVGALALKLANYECELNNGHETFISNTTSENYVEAHHLIPIKYHDEFEYNIDNEANIVALCPNCHRKLHFGQPKVKIKLLRTLYDERKEYLRKADIFIEWDKLVEMYKNYSKNEKIIE